MKQVISLVMQVILLLSFASSSWAEQQKTAKVPKALSSPRATMATFLHALNDVKRDHPERIDDAVSTLDLSDVNALVRKEKGRDLAWMLLEVMDRTQVINLQYIPEWVQGSDYVFAEYQQGAISIVQQNDQRWLFSAATIRDLPAILDELSDQKRVVGVDDDGHYLPISLRIRQQLPNSLKGRWLLLEHWQWLGILCIIVFGVILDKLGAIIFRQIVVRWRKRVSAYRELDDDLLRPFSLMLMAAAWWLGLNIIGLPDDVFLVLLVAAKFIAALSGVWGANRLVDCASAYFMQKAALTASRLDDMLVPLFTRVAKIFVTVIGIVFIADTLNMNISGLLAGLGLGGLAFALAAKDVVENLFGSITVLVDRPFHGGDWIRIGDIEGTVETIGFRSTQIRTFYNSVITVPNSRLITADVDNMGVRRYRRYKGYLSLAYDTSPERLEAFCEGVRTLVLQHPYTRKDYFHVYFHQYAASSLDILVYIFFEVPDWSTELRERHRFLLDALRLAQRLGVEFAYPTQTLYWKKSGGEVKPEDGKFEPLMSQQDAFSMGQNEAESIVAATLGGEKPPPVRF